MDALGAAAESQFGESTERYSDADWAREQQAEPACHGAMRYITLYRPPALPDDILPYFPSHQRPYLSEIHQLAGKGRLHATHGDTILLVRQPTPQPAPDSQRPVGRGACLLNVEPLRFYVSLVMRPWVMQACYSTASCHLGTTRALRTFERFNWWTGMSNCTRWCVHRCLKCQARIPRG